MVPTKPTAALWARLLELERQIAALEIRLKAAELAIGLSRGPADPDSPMGKQPTVT